MPILSMIDNRFASLVFDTNDKIVHHTFHRDLDSAHLRLVLNTGIELFETHGANKWLSDNRAIDPHSEEDTLWINQEWLPRVIKAGWKYWALVVPHDAKARMNMVEFVGSFYDQGVRVMVFTDLAPAMEWLRAAGR
jgi:hypothetical protein